MADIAAAMTMEALNGIIDAFDEKVQGFPTKDKLILGKYNFHIKRQQYDY